MQEVWNFHDYIAVKLEWYADKFICKNFSSADDIANGEFVYTMISVLKHKLGSNADIRDFVEICNEYDKVCGKDIPEDKAKEIFAEFERIVNLK